MAYGRRKGAKRPARKGVSKLLKKPTTAITTLAKAVKSIQLKMKRKVLTLNYGQQGDNQNLSSQYDVIKLSNYSSWSAIFGAGANDAEANKMIHKSFGIDMYFDANSETDNTHFTVFLVSLKDSIRGSAFNNSTGNLSLSNNVDYYQNYGFTLLNKKSFNIHGVRRFTLGNNGVGLGSSTAQTQYGTDRRIYMKASCNKTIENVNGDWKSLDCSPDPSDNYYILIFNDNGFLDATYPRLRTNIVHTVEQLA